MKQLLLDRIDNTKKIIAVVGLSKNAGKTTFLNWLVANFPSKKIGIITTGRDGEDIDLVGGHTKPKVLVPAGSFFSTFDNVIAANGSKMEVICKLPYLAGGRKLWLVKALYELNTEIVGPATATEQIELSKTILAQGVDHVFIDGSLDRKSVALSDEVDSLIVVASAAYGTLDMIRDELSRLYLLARLPICTETILDLDKICFGLEDKQIISAECSVLNNEKKVINISEINKSKWIYFPGAFTSRNFQILAPFLCERELIFKHPLHIQVDYKQLESIYPKISILNKIKIDAIALNSYSVKGNHIDSELLRNNMRNVFDDIPVVDVSEID